MRLVFDVETSIYNKGHPFDPRNILVSFSRKLAANPTEFFYYRSPDFLSELRTSLSRASEFVAFNGKFDLHWGTRVGCHLNGNCRIWDCSLAEFIISGQTAKFISLNEALESYGRPRKPDLVAEYWEKGISTEDIPEEILEEYNNYDVDGTSELQVIQQELMTPEQINLVYLMGEDLKALQHAEYHGIKFDNRLAEENKLVLSSRISDIERDLHQFLPKLGEQIKFNWDSGDQLSAFLYGGEIEFEYPIPETVVAKSGERMGQHVTRNRWHRRRVSFDRKFDPLEGTEVKKTREDPEATTRFYSTDAPTLKQLSGRGKDRRTILELLAQRADVGKTLEMVESIQKKAATMGWEHNIIHGQFNQNVVITGRLSSSGPNLQNTPVEVDELLVSRYVD